MEQTQKVTDGNQTKKDSDAGKDSGREEKGTAENEMLRLHHRLNGHVHG